MINCIEVDTVISNSVKLKYAAVSLKRVKIKELDISGRCNTIKHNSNSLICILIKYAGISDDNLYIIKAVNCNCKISRILHSNIGASLLEYKKISIEFLNFLIKLNHSYVCATDSINFNNLGSDIGLKAVVCLNKKIICKLITYIRRICCLIGSTIIVSLSLFIGNNRLLICLGKLIIRYPISKNIFNFFVLVSDPNGGSCLQTISCICGKIRLKEKLGVVSNESVVIVEYIRLITSTNPCSYIESISSLFQKLIHLLGTYQIQNICNKINKWITAKESGKLIVFLKLIADLLNILIGN